MTLYYNIYSINGFNQIRVCGDFETISPHKLKNFRVVHFESIAW